MSEEEISKRFCKFELCTHRNGEGMCCLYNQDNCIFHRLEKENHLLGERCNQLLKDKGNLTDQIADIKANCDLAIEGRDIKIKELIERLEDLQEQNSEMFNTIALQEQQIEKMKCCGNCKKEGVCDNDCAKYKDNYHSL